MFDKLKFNNFSISRSKDIQKGKIQVLRKTIQKIQKLKKLIERRSDDDGYKIKLRKYLEVVDKIKKVKKSELLTSILLLEKCPDKIVTNSHSTTDEIAIAMLATNPLIKALTEKIRDELELTNADSEAWKKVLIQISKQKLKRQRKKKLKKSMENAVPDKKKMKGKKVKVEKNSLKTSVETLPKVRKTKSKDEKKKNAFIDDPETEKTQSKVIADDVEKDSNESMQKIPKIKSKDTVKKEVFIDNEQTEIVENKTNALNTKSKTSKIKVVEEHMESNSKGTKDNKRTIKLPKIEHRESDEATNIKNYEKVADTYEEIEHLPKKIKKSNAVRLTQVVDPFFVTDNGSHYVTLAPVIEDDGKSEQNINFKPEIKEKSAEKYSRGFDSKISNHFGVAKQKSNFKEKHKDNQSQQTSTDLHPSWLAKQKLKPTITAFQGKKIKFEDNQSQQPPTDMHPSWIAKQKLKPTITAFQGKKIKFEDD